MLRLLADENFNARIVRGLLRREPALDLIRLQDVGLQGQPDPEVLAWAASSSRILLTHDVNTIPFFASNRIVAGEPMPGVFVVPSNAAIGEVIEDVLLLASMSEPGEWEAQIIYLPL